MTDAEPCEDEHDYAVPVMATYPLTYSCKKCGETFHRRESRRGDSTLLDHTKGNEPDA